MITDRIGVWIAGSLACILLITSGGLWLAGKKTAKERDAISADRSLIVAWAEKACGVTGYAFKQKDRKDWGANCFAEIVILRGFRTKATDQTNAELVKNLQTQLTKKDADLARAQRDKTLAFQALDALAEASANVPVSNEVGPAYYGALNRSAGLRDASGPNPAR